METTPLQSIQPEENRMTDREQFDIVLAHLSDASGFDRVPASRDEQIFLIHDIPIRLDFDEQLAVCRLLVDLGPVEHWDSAGLREAILLENGASLGEGLATFGIHDETHHAMGSLAFSPRAEGLALAPLEFIVELVLEINERWMDLEEAFNHSQYIAPAFAGASQ
jgi:hypothetical protein